MYVRDALPFDFSRLSQLYSEMQTILLGMEHAMSSEGIADSQMTKREFLKLCGASFCAVCAPGLFAFPQTSQAQMAKKGLIRTKLSPYFTSLDGGEIQCELCPRMCRISPGKRGSCRVRKNRDGMCYSLVFGNPCISSPAFTQSEVSTIYTLRL